MINTTIGKYKISRLIGEGGMASVYEAVHEMLGTKVAIKVLNPILSANAQIRERFRNEAKLMASLDHPNITKVIDFDDQPHQLSIIMEFLNGEDLDDKIKNNGPISEKEVSEIFTQTLSAFQYAHEKGIVHRDIKPSNIFILPNGQVKILDFGIAKLFGQGNEMTQTGTQMGTPIYMSPEQVKADKSIDHRSDIYSLGVTMFFAINGKPPYNSNTYSQFDIFNKIVFEPLPEFSIKSKYDVFILKACNKNREDRYQSCSEFLVKMQNGKKNETINEKEKTILEVLEVEKKIMDNPELKTKRNITSQKIENDQKKYKLIRNLTLIRFGFSILALLIIFSLTINYSFVLITIIPLNFILLIFSINKLLKIGISRNLVILNLIVVPLIILIQIFLNNTWRLSEDLYNNVFMITMYLNQYGILLILFFEIFFQIRTLLKIKRIQFN